MQRVVNGMVRSFDDDFQSALPESEIGNSFLSALYVTLSSITCGNMIIRKSNQIK